LYFDTSALIKLIVVEAGSDHAAELWDSYPAAASVLAYPEARAALAAARRVKRLTARAHDRAVAELDVLNAELMIVVVDEALAQRAGELADERALRGYDAVHLASALALDPGETTLVTWDHDLSDAAVGAGLGVAPAL
jgi:predicted nucleic acid-binding protein